MKSDTLKLYHSGDDSNFNTHTHSRFTALCPGLPGRPVPEETFTHSHLKRVVGVCHHSGFYEAWEDNRGKCTDNQAGRQSIQTTIDASTSIILQFYARCPSCHNPPNLSWIGTGTKYAGLHTWRLDSSFNGTRCSLIGPMLWGHSGSLCHALSLLFLLWTSMRRRHATVATPGEWQCKIKNRRRAAARSGEWAQHFSNASCLLKLVMLKWSLNI